MELLKPSRDSRGAEYKEPRTITVAGGPSRLRALFFLTLGMALLCGCQKPAGELFPAVEPPMIWPAVEAPAKIRYVGQLRSSADLKPPPKPFQGISDFLLGAQKPNQLYGPRSVVCSEDGERVWVADPGGRCLHLFNLQDRAYKKIHKVGQSPLLSPVGLCIGPGDSIYVCDSEDVAIHHLSGDSGTLIASLRLPEDIRRPVAISYDPSANELYVVDVSAHNIKVLGTDGGLRRIIGQRGDGGGQFNYPCDIADDGELIWIVDAGNHRVQGLNRSGEPVIAFGQVGDAPGDLAFPKGIALDSAGHIYVVDARFENVQIFDRSGHLLLFFGAEGTRPGRFWLPAGIYIDLNDRIWVCDSYNRRLQVFDYLKNPLPQHED